jgi:hypothetical protein
MKPERSNYETWLIDWLDGSLTAQQANDLMIFLDENPDIREEADALMLDRFSPLNDSFPGKKQLLRSVSDLTTSQAEYLSAAYLEGDLSPEQKTDLFQNIELNPENGIIFDKLQRTKLTAPEVHYRNKSSLKRITLASRIARISVIGLSAAAGILFLILNHMFISRPAVENNEAVAVLIADTILVSQPIILNNITNTQALTKVKNNIRKAVINIPSPASKNIALQTLPDSSLSFARTDGPALIAFNKLPSVINTQSEPMYPALIASANINYTESVYNDDDRSRLSRFIAKTFRNKILKEKQVNDEPLQTYELAEAGIEGLNKLLGWQMALVKTNDEAGELKSVYFSSNLLKFNAPVRKTTEAQ